MYRTDPGDLGERAIEVRLGQVLEDVRRDHRVEPPVGEHRHVVDAADLIRLERVVDVEGRHLVAAPAQHLGVESLPGTDNEHRAAAGQTLQIPELIVRVDEVRQVQLLRPYLAVDGHDGRLRNR